jgi:hypothetical protein
MVLIREEVKNSLKITAFNKIERIQSMCMRMCITRVSIVENFRFRNINSNEPRLNPQAIRTYNFNCCVRNVKKSCQNPHVALNNFKMYRRRAPMDAQSYWLYKDLKN